MQLLHQPKEQLFHILPCVGWKYIQNLSCVSFGFEVQPKPSGGAVSLQRLLFHAGHRPELDDKFRLSLGLLECIVQLHIVQWVSVSILARFLYHGADNSLSYMKVFRSDNVLLFPHFITDDSGEQLNMNYTTPWVLGFEYSSPDPFFSAGKADFEPTRDVYHHPRRQGQLTETFKKIHGMYASGVVLLEIGLWGPALKLQKSVFAHVENPRTVQAQLFKHAQRRLE